MHSLEPHVEASNDLAIKEREHRRNWRSVGLDMLRTRYSVWWIGGLPQVSLRRMLGDTQTSVSHTVPRQVGHRLEFRFSRSCGLGPEEVDNAVIAGCALFYGVAHLIERPGQSGQISVLSAGC